MLSTCFVMTDDHLFYHRDDRCISDNGREAWFPFLDEQVVALLQSLPMEQVRTVAF